MFCLTSFSIFVFTSDSEEALNALNTACELTDAAAVRAEVTCCCKDATFCEL